MLARLVATAGFVVLLPLGASATTPFASHCEGNICYQRKVNTGCMTEAARRLLREIANRFGKIEVASVCDGRHARRSAHYVGKAIDFRPFAAPRADVVAFLKASPNVGGVGTYSNGLIHADVADRKMAWHGRGRGRVVWPIGAGTIEKSPDDAPAPVVQASAFSFFDLWKSPAPAAGEDRQVLASALPAGTGVDPLAAAVGSKLPPLPPRRPAILLELASERAATVQVARAESATVEISASGEVGRAVTPTSVLAVSSLTVAALRTTPAEPERRPPPAITPPPGPWAEAKSASTPIPGFQVVGAEPPVTAAAPARTGFGADESLFSTRAFTQHPQPGFSLARANLP